MTSSVTSDWVKLGEDGRGWLALTANGKPSTGSPARVRFKAISCEGERSTELWGVDEFCKQLASLHRDLKGEARLAAMEGDFELVLKPVDGMGHLMAEAMVGERFGGPVEFELKFNFQVDQSHIPSFLSGLRAQFLVTK